MERAELAFIVTAVGMGATMSLAAALIRGVWTGRLPQLRIVGPSTVLSLLAIGLSTGLQQPIPGTMVAGVAVASAPCGGATGHFVSVSEHGERARLTGTGNTDGRCAIWAAIEDPRTGAFWLQGPALVDGASWMLDLVFGTYPAPPGPLAYRVTVFAVDTDTSADWLAVARGAQQPRRLATVPAPESWLAVALPLGAPAPKRGG